MSEPKTVTKEALLGIYRDAARQGAGVVIAIG